MLDDDKRQLRLYQERYLADGDLHSDGPGRMRKFRWKNIGILIVAFRCTHLLMRIFVQLKMTNGNQNDNRLCGGPGCSHCFLLLGGKILSIYSE